ncbi:MAG: hypothetical protein DMG21_00410 [Acidobacteria bacterium]|nr:MAG: hypothetical protein DMG21_00410 [Acidobacteriota bacterium]
MVQKRFTFRKGDSARVVPFSIWLDPGWRVTVSWEGQFGAELVVHIHPPDRRPLAGTTVGQLLHDRVVLPTQLLAGKKQLSFEVS